MTDTGLIASSSTEIGIIAQISKYYGGSTITLHQRNPKTWDVLNNKGKIEGKQVVLSKKRYRFCNAS